MLASLTTNVTRYFREPHHFEHLKSRVLPELVTRARAGGRVRLWSAGCSTGQEAYTIALTLLEAMPEAADRDVRILATDIDPNVVATGRAAAYSDDAVQPVPPALRSRWMVRVKDGGRDAWGCGEEMRRLVSFRELNLMGTWPMKGRFDVIFCRNVVIYFDEPTQARIWSRFAPLLTPGGRLYVGHSERVTDLAKFETDGLTTYRLRDGMG
jgi:chemotaxis protein methyltransferase CheR